jgi:hypothetical protein
MTLAKPALNGPSAPLAIPKLIVSATEPLTCHVLSTHTHTHTDKWLDCDLQRTDPASRQRGRPTETRQQIPDPNSWKGSNIWSNVHKVGSTPRHTDWLTDWLSAVVTLTLTIELQRTDPASRQRGRPTETRQQISDPNTEKEAISGQTSTKWARHQDILTDWLTDSRKVTLTECTL